MLLVRADIRLQASAISHSDGPLTAPKAAVTENWAKLSADDL